MVNRNVMDVSFNHHMKPSSFVASFTMLIKSIFPYLTLIVVFVNKSSSSSLGKSSSSSNICWLFSFVIKAWPFLGNGGIGRTDEDHW